MKLSIRQSVELFHMVLLSMLGKKLDKQQYALKGGCNLRFFFGSPRYSEDMAYFWRLTVFGGAECEVQGGLRTPCGGLPADG